MKIGIDVQSTVGNMTGLGYYVSNLVKGFKNDDTFEFTYYKGPKKELNTLDRIYWENVLLAKHIKKDKPDLLHIPGFAGPIYKGKRKTLTTVHDLIGMIYPKNLNPASRFYWQRWLPMCVKNSHMIIAISENTKKDIMRFMNVSENKIRVILSAVEERFVPIKDEKELKKIKQKYNLPPEFVLNIGTIEPRKNVCGLIEAFASYIRDSNTGLNLVISGKRDWGYKEAHEKVNKLGIASRVKFTGYVDDEDLPALYNLAKFFVFPSFYEGFGFPVLEAMSCGRPVISSNTSSLPEITRDSVIQFSPYDMNEFKKAIETMDKDTSVRKEFSERAFEQSRKFSWDKTRTQTLKVYREMLDK